MIYQNTFGNFIHFLSFLSMSSPSQFEQQLARVLNTAHLDLKLLDSIKTFFPIGDPRVRELPNPPIFSVDNNEWQLSIEWADCILDLDDDGAHMNLKDYSMHDADDFLRDLATILKC